MYILRGNIKENIEKILSEEAEILNANDKQKKLFVQLCERSFINLRDWLAKNREVLLSDSQIDYCGRIIMGDVVIIFRTVDFVYLTINNENYVQESKKQLFT